MTYIQPVLSRRYKRDWLWRETPGESQTFQETSSSHAAAAKAQLKDMQQAISKTSLTPF